MMDIFIGKLCEEHQIIGLHKGDFMGVMGLF
jgi:hypothetical protein